MFLHNLLYEIRTDIRTKDVILWLMLFPIILGTLFKASFSGLYETATAFSTIPCAVVENKENELLHTVLDSVTEGEDALLSVTYADENHALQMLKDGEICGILYSDDRLSLTVDEEGVKETVLKSFAEQYNAQQTVIRDTMEHDPMQLQAVIDALSADVSPITEIPLTQGNTDNYTAFFYNLIAMVAMYGMITGLHITIGSQANLSALGARRCCSPTPKFISLAAGLLGSYLVQGLCMVICVTFEAFVLKVDFGERLPLVYVSALLGGVMGVSLGFFVGSINHFSENAKASLSFAVSMFFCFMSGLMVSAMKPIVATHAPWFNNINPAAIVCDSFYYLNIDSGYDRFIGKLVTMVMISVIFTVLGAVMSRRKKYASL